MSDGQLKQNAASIAAMVLTTETLITDLPELNDPDFVLTPQTQS